MSNQSLCSIQSEAIATLAVKINIYLLIVGFISQHLRSHPERRPNHRKLLSFSAKHTITDTE